MGTRLINSTASLVKNVLIIYALHSKLQIKNQLRMNKMKFHLARSILGTLNGLLLGNLNNITSRQYLKKKTAIILVTTSLNLMLNDYL